MIIYGGKYNGYNENFIVYRFFIYIYIYSEWI